MMTPTVRVAVAASNPFEAEELGRRIIDPDVEVMATVTNTAIDDVLTRHRHEVVVLAGDHQLAVASRLRSHHPWLKIVATCAPQGATDVDAWATRPDDVAAAVLSTFLY